jgi:Fur family ferric uptake transcriptional regulator
VTDFPNKLNDAGLKITLPRLKILEILETHAEQHFSVEDIYKLLLQENEEVGIATIYRVLTQCEQAGLVKRLQFEEGPAVFELSRDDHHDHFVCTGCGMVEEFHDSIIEERQREIAAKAGYEMEDHNMVLYGLCAKCRKKTENH